MRLGLGLTRVSKVGDRGDDLISPELQRTAIETYSAAKGIRIVAWVEALDESGSQRRSKWWQTLDATITRMEAERLDVIVVWKFSRMSRDRLKWAVSLDRIESAGATLESATEGVDTTTSTGRFTRGMLAELEAFRAEQIGDVWREVKQRRLRLGLPGDGHDRFGYDRVDGRYVPNEWALPLATVYEQRASGAPLGALARWLNDQGAVTTRNSLWQRQTLRQTLTTGFAAGLLKTSSGYLPGAHEPIISMAVWEAFLPTLQPGTDRSSTRYEMSQLLRCAYCGKYLHPHRKEGWAAGTMWRCGTPFRGGDCPGAYGWAPAVREKLLAWVGEVLAGRDRQYQEAVAARPARVSKTQTARLLRVENDLIVLGQKNLRGFYDDDTYLRMRAALLDERRMLQKLTAPAAPAPPPRSAFDALLALDDPAERNVAWRKVLHHVTVRSRDDLPKYDPIPRWVVVGE